MLARRRIFTDRALELIALQEAQGGLNAAQAQEFVEQALETFRWHNQATVSAEEYRQLHDQHRLIADVVAFKGPHINHLTPRTLDIDRVQQAMPGRGITPKAVIEGPPRRRRAILLRQTSFKALEESVDFVEHDGHAIAGHHTARFGEIEQRGVALTPKGRALYDRLLQATNDALQAPPSEKNAERYYQLLEENFRAFPDDYATLREQQLAWFRYFPTECGRRPKSRWISTVPRSNCSRKNTFASSRWCMKIFCRSAQRDFPVKSGDSRHAQYNAASSRAAFEQALGSEVIDELALYQQTQQRSLEACAQAPGLVTLAS